jgi:hypothetical protein
MRIIRLAQQSYNFYHGTTTGENNSTLQSVRQGIKTDMSTGEGQGYGFYVLVSKQDAIEHSQGEFRKKGGVPMIVTINAPLTPKHFEIDHEVMSHLTGQFIFDTWETVFKKLPNKTIQFETNKGTGPLNIEKSRISSFGTMVFWIDDPEGIKRKLAMISTFPQTDTNQGLGRTFGQIFNAIKKYMPEAILEFEEKALQNTIKAKGALKYIGPSIQPSKLEALINGQWVDVTTQDPPTQENQENQENQTQARGNMRIIRVAFKEIKHWCHAPGHLEEGEIIDYHKGLITGYRRTEIENQVEECPRCYENFLTVKHNIEYKRQIERSKPVDEVSLDLDNSFLDEDDEGKSLL